MAAIREGEEEGGVESGDNSTLDRDWQQKGACRKSLLVTSTGGGLCGWTYRGNNWWRHDFLSMPRQDPEGRILLPLPPGPGRRARRIKR